MGDARLNPRQLVAILTKLDVVAAQIAEVRGELIRSMADRRSAPATRGSAPLRLKRSPRRADR